LIVSPAQLETEAETATERLLEEIDNNQDADDGVALCGNQSFTARSCCIVALTSTPSTGHVIAEK